MPGESVAFVSFDNHSVCGILSSRKGYIVIVEIIQRNTIRVNSEAVRELLCLAFEGGSNYWYRDLEKGRAATDAVAKGVAFQSPSIDRVSIVQHTEDDWTWAYTLPTCGGSVMLTSSEDERDVYTLDDKAIKRGLEAMAVKFPARLQGHFFQTDYDSDAEDGDVFLQCCLFGDVIYG
jgi:hypothetical protein